MAELVRRCRPLLGTFVEISAEDAEAIETAFGAIARVHRLMSAHERDSDVSRINRFAHIDSIEIDPWTALVIERALFWSKRSEGTFDVVRAGKAALASGYLPRHADQPGAEAAHWTWLELQGRSVRLLKAACLDLGGVAKGFAVDRAVEALRAAGCSRGLVNAGGDLRCFGPGPWPVSIVDPLSRRPVADVGVENGALATSAGLAHARGGLSFDHLGGQHGDWTSVSVLARTACDADALTKIVWAQGAEAQALLASVDATALLVSATGRVETIGADELADA
jgi:thiamine biosynthesis lipoprotein